VTSSSAAQSLPLPPELTSDVNGFQYLKRDLVRLLGILCSGSKAVQDHVRDRGGIEVVMNLCVVDERNPCWWLSFLRPFLAVHHYVQIFESMLFLRYTIC